MKIDCLMNYLNIVVSFFYWFIGLTTEVPADLNSSGRLVGIVLLHGVLMNDDPNAELEYVQ